MDRLMYAKEEGVMENEEWKAEKKRKKAQMAAM